MIDICALPHDNIPARVPFSLHLGPQCGCGGSLGKLHNFRSCRQQGLASTPRNYMPLHCYCVNQWTTSYAITDNMIFTWSWCRGFTLWILISKLYMCLTRKSLLAQQRSLGRGAEFMARVLFLSVRSVCACWRNRQWCSKLCKKIWLFIARNESRGTKSFG